MSYAAGITHDVVFTTFAGTEYGFMLSDDPEQEGTKYFVISESSSFADKISEGEASYVQTNPETDLVWNQDDWTGGCGLEKIKGNETNRYWDATNVDARWPHSVMLAPRMNYCTYTTTTAIDCGSAATNRGTVVTSGTGTPTTIQVQVNIEHDHGTQYASGGYYMDTFGGPNSSATESIRVDCGAVFDNVTIPQGATIVAATLEAYSPGTDYDDINCKLYGNDVDNANNYDTEDVLSRTLTTAYTSWVTDSVGSGWVTSPDIASVIQEIVSRAAWATGNSLSVILKGNSDSTKYCYFYDYTDGSTYAPKLNITYITSGTPRTYIDINNSANYTGTITQVQIYSNTLLSGVKVGTFSGSGTSYTVVDSESIADVEPGAVRTYSVSLTVNSGNFMGIYFAGSLEADSTGSAAVYYYAGDGTTSGAKTYTQWDASAAISLYGTGETAAGGSTAMGTIRGYNSFCQFGSNLYCIAAGASDTYVWRLDTNVWTIVLTDTDALNPRGIVTYGNGTANYIIAFMDSKYYHSTTGAASSWTAVTKDVEHMIVIKGVLWAANGATVFSCTDPTNVSDWTTTTTIGDNNFSITHLYERDGILYVAKPDGLWSFDANSKDENLTPEFRQVSATENFKYGCITKNLGVFSTFYDGVMLYDGSNLTDIAPGIDSTTLTVSGTSLVGIANGVDWVYAIYRVFSGDNDTIQIVAGRLQYEDGNLRWAWHPLWYGVTYSNPYSEYHDGMIVCGSAETSFYDTANPKLWTSQSNYRLDAGGSSFTVASYTPGNFILPRGHKAPNEDDNCRFVYTETGASTHPGIGYMYTPSWDGGFPDQDKAFIYFALGAEGLYTSGGTDYTYIKISYKIDEATAWTDLTTDTTDGVWKVNFPVGTYGKKIKFRYTFGNARGYYYTPILKSTTLHSVLKTRRRKTFEMLLKVSDHQILLDSSESSLTASEIKANIFSCRDQSYPLTLNDPDNDSYTVQVKVPVTIKRLPDVVEGEQTHTEWRAHLICEEVLKA